MTALKQIDKYFWICLILAIVFGLYLPGIFSPFQDWILYVIMAMLFLVFIKVDIKDMVNHVRNPFLMLYIVAFNMVLMPILLYFIFHGRIDQETVMGLVLLAALPCGVSSAAFTDIMEGHTSLTLTIILVSTLVAPFTIPFIFWALYNTNLELDYFGLLKSLLMIIMIPAAASQFFKNLFENYVDRAQKYVNIFVVFLTAFMVATILSVHAGYILTHLKQSLPLLAILYFVFFLLQILGYFSVFWLKKGEKVAVSNSNIIMNNMLGVVLAMAFFTPKIVMLIVLSILPWNTVLIIFHWYKKYLP
jgi:predicted Na+-dependent transporter